MLIFILPGLLLTWAIASLIGHSGGDSADDGAGTERRTELDDTDNQFSGNAADDTVLAGGGDDLISGNLGADTLVLGSGDDEGHGGAGTDTIYGGDGNDFMDGGTNDDKLYGGDGDDATYLPGTDGSPEMFGEEGGNDLIRGGAGNDTLFDGLGRNTIYGDSGDDIVDGREIGEGNTPDQLFGGNGDDLVVGDDGDQMSGGNGSDIFGVAYSVGNDPVHINDYDKDSAETILVEVPDPDTAILTLLERGDDTLVKLGDATVAILEGVTGIDPENVVLVGNEDAAPPVFTT